MNDEDNTIEAMRIIGNSFHGTKKFLFFLAFCRGMLRNYNIAEKIQEQQKRINALKKHSKTHEIFGR